MRNVLGGMIFLAAMMLSANASGQTTATPKAMPKQAKPVAPHFLPPKVDPALPNVLLIGDSISIGYTIGVRKALDGEANVWRPSVNCGPTTRGIDMLDQWLGDKQWDVIHFNFGLHDLKYIGKEGQLADLADSKGIQVPIDQYSENLRQIATQLKATGATVIWRETTPVPKGAKGRVPDDAVRYNSAAAEVIEQVGGIETDPMFQFATEKSNLQKRADVHYTAAGSTELANHVADVIRMALKKR